MRGHGRVIGLDTNVLVRMMVMDDPIQTATVHKLMQTLSTDSPGFVSQVVLTELFRVLSSRYGYSRAQLGNTLELLLRAVGLSIEHRDAVWNALYTFRTTKADFADCLIAHSGIAAGCEYTLTFDADAGKLVGMQLLR
jgi:predicted nucleic-acid-binding protein